MYGSLNVNAANGQASHLSPIYRGCTLHRLAQSGRADLISQRLNPRVDVNAKDAEGFTAIYYAVLESHAPVVTALLAAGADTNVRAGESDNLMMLAVKSGSGSVVGALADHQVDLNSFEGGVNPLMLASEMGSADMVNALLKSHPNSSLVDANGRNALMIAAEKGCVDVVAALINYQSNHWAEMGAVDVNGMSALMLAAKNGKLGVVNLLMEAKGVLGIFTNGREEGRAMVHAARNGHVDVVAAFLQMGVDVDFLDDEGCTALSASSESCQLRMGKYLLGVGANDEAQKSLPQAALDVSRIHSRAENAGLLMQARPGMDKAAVAAYA